MVGVHVGDDARAAPAGLELVANTCSQAARVAGVGDAAVDDGPALARLAFLAVAQQPQVDVVERERQAHAQPAHAGRHRQRAPGPAARAEGVVEFGFRAFRGPCAASSRRAGTPPRPARGAPRRADDHARRGAGAGGCREAGPAQAGQAMKAPRCSRSAHRLPRLRHRPGDARRLQPPLPAVPRGQRARPSSASRRPTGTASSARSASASSSTTCASTKPPSGCSASSRPRSCRWTCWQQVKLHYIGLLTDHHQPELAETFFNSVTTKILHRSYFHNDFIFVRPAVSTEYIENDEPAALPTYRAYYPTRDTLRDTWLRIVDNFQLQRAVRGPGARRRPWCCAAVRAAARRRAAARQLPDPGAVVAVLPQQGRLRGRQDHQRLQRDAVRAADPARRAAASW